MLRAVQTGSEVSRVGFTTGRALGNAVVRNRLKRRLREAVWSLPVRDGWDIVINARRGAETADYGHLQSCVGDLMRRAGVLREER